MVLLAAGAGWYFFFSDSSRPSAAMAAPVEPHQQPKRKPTTKRAAATKPAATQQVSQSPKKQAPTPAADPLAQPYVDLEHGFSIRFPKNWPIRSFNDAPWILDCGDANAGLISIGFSPCPREITADQLLPEAIARRIKRRPNTTLIAQGKTTIAGKKALWSKSVGPLPMTNGSPRMTRVQYIVPLQDGRVLELRVAVTPQAFDLLAPLMQKSIATFTLTPRKP